MGVVGLIRARPGVVGFIPVRWVRSSAPWVHVVGFIRLHWVGSGEPWGSSGSFGFVGFIRARIGIHSGLFGSLECAMEFIQARLGGGRRSGANRGSLGLFGFVGFIRARTGGRRFHSCSLGSFGHALVSTCSFGFVRALHGGRRVHSGSLGSSMRALGVVGFVGFIRARQGCRLVNYGAPWDCRVHSGAPLLSSSSFGFVGFIRSRPGGRPAHLVSLGSFKRALVVVGFIRVHWDHSGEPLRSLGLFGVVGFIRAHTNTRWVHSGAPVFRFLR